MNWTLQVYNKKKFKPLSSNALMLLSTIHWKTVMQKGPWLNMGCPREYFIVHCNSEICNFGGKNNTLVNFPLQLKMLCRLLKKSQKKCSVLLLVVIKVLKKIMSKKNKIKRSLVQYYNSWGKRPQLLEMTTAPWKESFMATFCHGNSKSYNWRQVDEVLWLWHMGFNGLAWLLFCWHELPMEWVKGEK